MSHSIETVRKALKWMHRYAIGETDSPYMRIPADPDHDADLILSAAIDELEGLREERDDLVERTRVAEEWIKVAASGTELAEKNDRISREGWRAEIQQREKAEADAAAMRAALEKTEEALDLAANGDCEQVDTMEEPACGDCQPCTAAKALQVTREALRGDE